MKTIHPKYRENKLRLAIMTSTMFSAMSIGYSDVVLAQEDEEELEEIVVTGSRIRRQDFTANSPIVTIDETTFEETSTIGLDTVLNQLPQFIPGMTGSVINGAQEFRTGGSQFAAGGIEASAFATPGASSVNLRGLGAGRNLVLVDGRRGMPVNASMTVDINSIPSTALERIEVVSGGASAVYGADAVAGAINFILKDDYEGLSIQSNYGISELGDAEEYRASGLFGANTPDGRGNVMLGLEYSSRGEGDFAERDWFLDERRHPNVNGNEFFFSDTYVANLFMVPQGTVDSLFPEAAPGSVAPSANFYVNKTADGTGSVYTGAGGNNRAGGYKYEGPLEVNGFPFRKIDPAGGIQQNQLINFVSVPLERYSLFARGRYEVTDNVEAFANLTFARSHTRTASQYSPAVFGWGAQIPHGPQIYADSFEDPAAAVTGYDPVTGAPIYDPDAATAAAYLPGGTLGLNCPATGGCTNSQVWPKPAEVNTLLDARQPFVPGFGPSDPAYVNRVLDFIGERQTTNRTTNYQFIVGLEGELDNGWYWDASVSHGESEVVSQLENFASLDRYLAIAQAPNYGRGVVLTGNEQGNGFGAGTASCTSGLPLFEDFEVSQDCLNAIRVNLAQNGQMNQDGFIANLGGTLLEMPAGPLQFAAGIEYRKNDYVFKSSDNNQSENFHSQVIGLFPNNATIGAVGVKEIYGEVLVPLVSNGPMGMRELNLEIGGRLSDYYDTSGEVDTAKFLVDWLVTDWVRFRGGYQRATRAPNIQELFTGRAQQVFTPGSAHGDVCSLNNFDSELSAATGTQPGSGLEAPASAEQAAQTLAMCRQQMGEAASTIYYDEPIEDQPDPGQGGQVFLTGNPNVQPESADTFTAGLVMTSPFRQNWLQGLTLSVDWYQIEVEDMIAQFTTTTIAERCYSLEWNPTGDINSEFCSLIRRNPSDGSPLSLDTTFTNETRVKLSGLDVNLNWNAQFQDFGMDLPGGFGVNMLATFPLKIDTQTNELSPVRDWVGHQGGGDCPSGVSCTGYDYQLFTTFNYFNGPLNMSLRWQHLPDIKSGALVTNPNSTSQGVHSSYNMFALTGGYQLNQNLRLQAGIENLFDKKPPLAGGNPDATPYPTPPIHTSGGTYDPLGRRYFVALNMTF